MASIDVGAVCPSILVGSDDYPVALCTRVAGVTPVVLLLDPDSGEPLASFEPTPGSLFGGVYGYLDDADRMVLVDGDDDLLRIAHRRDGELWVLELDERVPLGGAVPGGDEVTSVAPGYNGTVMVGDRRRNRRSGGPRRRLGVRCVAPGRRADRQQHLDRAQRHRRRDDHPVYLFDLEEDGRLVQRWRHEYERVPHAAQASSAGAPAPHPPSSGPPTGPTTWQSLTTPTPRCTSWWYDRGRTCGESICARGVARGRTRFGEPHRSVPGAR
ncbi:MAG: hypothetical protein R2716_13650 [Microthrixaceae bacterium]